jgi:hypothetical protein
MFAAMDSLQFSPHMPVEVFACTVGQKPSKVSGCPAGELRWHVGVRAKVVPRCCVAGCTWHQQHKPTAAVLKPVQVVVKA